MKQNKRQSCVNNTRFLNILIILKSVMSMIAIDILLAHFNNRFIFDWNDLTLNAIVAVFSVMFKVMLIYTLFECLKQVKWIWFFSQQRFLNDIDRIDRVNRESLRSFQILTKFVVRSFINMSVIIVILSMIMNSFVQLIIDKRNNLKFENNTYIQIIYAKRYSTQLFIVVDNTTLTKNVDLKMKFVILQNLFQSNSLIFQQIKLFCFFENCIWDIFISTTICSDCNDFTNQIKKINLIVKYNMHFD